MRAYPAHIPTTDLSLVDVPNESASWQTIGNFALTFDPAESDPYHPKGQDFTLLSGDSSLVQLRSHLFLEQRRWNHIGRAPDAARMSAIRKVVALIRTKLSEHSKGTEEPGT
jgi:hypothetical protein